MRLAGQKRKSKTFLGTKYLLYFFVFVKIKWTYAHYIFCWLFLKTLFFVPLFPLRESYCNVFAAVLLIFTTNKKNSRWMVFQVWQKYLAKYFRSFCEQSGFYFTHFICERIFFSSETTPCIFKGFGNWLEKWGGGGKDVPKKRLFYLTKKSWTKKTLNVSHS